MFGLFKKKQIKTQLIPVMAGVNRITTCDYLYRGSKEKLVQKGTLLTVADCYVLSQYGYTYIKVKAKS